MTDQLFAQLHVPTRIVCAPGIARDFSTEWQALKVTRPLIVTDAGIVRAGLLAGVRDGLIAAGATIAAEFTDVPPNSELRVIESCAACARANRADSVIAVGGGSVIDTAKLTAVLLTHGGDLLRDYAGAQTVPGALVPLVAIPTTAGTGSEVTQAAVVFDAASGRKLSFVDENLRPRLALLDPELTVGLPVLLTAATGMDALTHAIEAFVDIQHSPLSDALAVHAARLIRASLLPALHNGNDVTARAQMLMAAALAGIAFDHSMVGVVHALSHALGALAHVHHGTANAILLPIGLQYNWDACLPRYAEFSRAVGVSSSSTDDATAAQSLVAWQSQLREQLFMRAKLPRTLAAAQIDRALIPQIVTLAIEDGASFYNPRALEAEPLTELLETMWG